MQHFYTDKLEFLYSNRFKRHQIWRHKWLTSLELWEIPIQLLCANG